MAIGTTTLSIIFAKVTSSLIDYNLDSGWSKIFNGNTNGYKKSLKDILIKH